MSFPNPIGDLPRWLDYAVLVSGFSALVYILGRAIGLWHWIWSKLVPMLQRLIPPGVGPPQETMRFIPKDHLLVWTDGENAGRPIMHIRADFLATNITMQEIQIARVELRRPHGIRARWRWRMANSSVTMRPIINSTRINATMRCLYPYAPGEVSMAFSVEPPICSPGESLIATVVFTDNLGNEHECKNLSFKSL